MAEVRPWLGSSISVGQFKTVRELKVINCSANPLDAPRYYFQEPSPEDRLRSVWSDIDRAFATPITPADDIADYVPTQILAELFKSKGYDGIIYRSSFGKGYNVTLFDLETTELVNCSLYRVKDLNFNFEQAGNPYCIANPAGKKCASRK